MKLSAHDLSLTRRGARFHFDLAIALISIIPFLTLAGMASVRSWWIPQSCWEWVPFAVAFAFGPILGYSILAKYPSTITRLRKYLEDVVRGEIPDKINLLCTEDDLAAVEDSMNMILEKLKQKVVLVQMANQKLEGELFQARKFEAVGTLAAGIAHEINAPIQFVSNNMRFFSETSNELFGLLERMPDPDDGTHSKLEFLRRETKQSLVQSKEGLDRVAEIVHAMRVFARKGEEGEKVPADINEAIRNTIEVSRNEWKYVARMDTALEPDLPPVPCFLGEIKRALMDLIINAAHAILEKGDRRQGQIVVTTRRECGFVAVSVRDTGIGIPDGLKTKVFEPFFTTKEVGHGKGQGLSVAYASIVNRHDGRFFLRSRPGKGSTFTFCLPLSQPSGETARDQDEPEPATAERDAR